MKQHEFLIDRALRFRRELTRISLLHVMGAITTLALPWLAGQLLGGVIDARLDNAAVMAGLLFAVLVATTFLRIAGAIVSARTSAAIFAQLRLDTYRHIQLLPMRFHDRSDKGELLSLMTFEIGRLSDFLTTTLATMPAMLLTAAGSLILLFVMDPVLALVLPLVVPLFYIVLRLAGRRLRATAEAMRNAETEVIEKAETHLETLPATKAFGMEEAQFERYTKAVDESRYRGVLNEQVHAVIGPVTGMIAALAALAVVFVAGLDIAGGTRSAGELFSILLYAALLTRPAGGLAEVYGRLQMARGTLARLQAVLGEDLESGYSHGEAVCKARGAVEFCDVHFSYPGREKVLRAANLTIAPGEIIAVTGENGAGKSTIVNLLLRFCEADSGTITIDGAPIAGMQVQAMRRLIGHVPQRIILFSGSLRDNIAFGFPDASEAEIAAAVRLAQAEDFVASLADGLETQIGDRGVRLSGGQRQRIALARALLLHPPIMIFDEATAMFDLDGEAAFVESIKGALAGRTVIIITHRKAMLALADRIVRVVDGRIEEVGAPSLPAG